MPMGLFRDMSISVGLRAGGVAGRKSLKKHTLRAIRPYGYVSMGPVTHGITGINEVSGR